MARVTAMTPAARTRFTWPSIAAVRERVMALSF